MIGIIAAMNVEMESLRSHIENPVTETVGGVAYVSGQLEGQEVVTAVCGVGKVFAALCAQAMILRYRPECIINTGVAGTLTDRLSVGDIAVSTGVVQHDMDTSPIGDPLGLISGINKVVLPADEALAKKLTACASALGIKTLPGSAARKAFIVGQFDAIACEMEGAAVGQACYVNGVPFCVLRAISDSADGSSHMD